MSSKAAFIGFHRVDDDLNALNPRFFPIVADGMFRPPRFWFLNWTYSDAFFLEKTAGNGICHLFTILAETAPVM